MSEQIVGKIEHLTTTPTSTAPCVQREFTCYVPKLVSETTFRSKPMVNMTDDMVKVELVMSRNDWRRIKKSLKNLST